MKAWWARVDVQLRERNDRVSDVTGSPGRFVVVDFVIVHVYLYRHLFVFLPFVMKLELLVLFVMCM